MVDGGLWLLEILDSDVALWERYLDVVFPEGVIDDFQHVADDIGPLDSIGPDEEFEVDTGVAQTTHH